MNHDDLIQLKEDFSGLDLAQAEHKGRELFRELYLDGEKPFGIRRTHDQETVIFHLRAQFGFEHSFFTSSDLIGHPYRKDVLDLSRLERIRWIGPLIQGEIEGAEYRRETFWRKGKPFHKRLYLIREERYLVWLEPHMRGGWKFATAYVAKQSALDDYSRKTLLKRTL